MRMQNESGREVVACALGQAALAERRLRWNALSARAGIDIVASDSGLRLIYRADNEVEQELRELAALERARSPTGRSARATGRPFSTSAVKAMWRSQPFRKCFSPKRWTLVDVRWTLRTPAIAASDNAIAP
jgi:hypothetical protein